MVSKLKIALILMSVFLALSGCKKNNWYEWKMYNEVWMEQNRLALQDDPRFEVLPSGLQVRILGDPNPTEQRPHAACTISCNYETYLVNGALIDQQEEAYFTVSSLVAGFQEGLRKIHVHGDIELWIPTDLAYGKDGSGAEGYKAYVPPYSALYIKLHLLSSSAN